MSKWRDVTLVVTNTLAVVFLVVIIKFLYGEGFRFPSAMTTLHFVLTGLAGCIYRFGFMSPDDAVPQTRDIAVLASLKMGSMVSSNLSLMFNSVNLFEVLRFINIPLMCLVEYVWRCASHHDSDSEGTGGLHIVLHHILPLLCTSINLSTLATPSCPQHLSTALNYCALYCHHVHLYLCSCTSLVCIHGLRRCTCSPSCR